MCIGFLCTLVVRRPSGSQSCNCGVEESKFVVVLCPHCEVDGSLLVVQMVLEAINISTVQDGESVINVAFPRPRFVG